MAEYSRKRHAAMRAGTWQPRPKPPTERVNCSGPGCVKAAKYLSHTLCAAHAAQKRAGKELTPLIQKNRIKDGKKVCSACGELLPLSEYPYTKTTGGRPTSRCKPCLSVATRARRHGLTIGQVEALSVMPCQTCGRVVSGRDQHIDHDHETGEVRGVLCRFCNAVLMKHMSPDLLRRLADYLESPPGAT